MFEAPHIEVQTPEGDVNFRVKHKRSFERKAAWLAKKIALGSTKYFSEVVTVCPVLAFLLRELNTDNRLISKQNLISLTNDVNEGRFMFNGDSIVISSNGILVDGQHRLETIIKTGVSLDFVLVFGVDPKARFTKDIGKPKSVATFLYMKRKGHATALAATANYLSQWISTDGVKIGNVGLTKTELMNFISKNKNIEESVEFTYRTVKAGGIGSHAVLAFAHAVFWRVSTRDLADQFIDKLIDGDSLKKGDAILYCRDQFSKMHAKIPAPEKIDMLFKCWNNWRRQKTVTSLRFTGGPLPKLER